MTVSYNNMQPSVAVTEVIALSGIFPPHDVGTGTPGYLGAIREFAFNFAPGGTMATHGQLLPIMSHTALFSLMGDFYGGDGTTNFALPNLDHRLSVDGGQGSGLADHPQFEYYGFADTTLVNGQLPTSVGGGGQVVDNTAPSLAVHYVINAFGTYGSGQLDEIGLVWQFAGNFDPGGTIECDGRLLLIEDYTALFSKIGTLYGGDGITTFALPDLRGRSIVGADGSGTDIGAMSGSESIILGDGNLPNGVHFPTGTGADQPFDNQGPTLTMRYIIAVEGIFPSHDGSGPLDAETPILGEIIAYAGTDIPDGWMACNGQLLPINQNQALFSLLGTQYGGNGQTNFAIPDFTGRAIVGTDGTDVGTVLGTETVTLGLDNIPPMTIEGTNGNDDGITGIDLAGANSDDFIRGHGGSDLLTGRGGNDWLDGGDGIDTMIGGLGNDIYTVNRAEEAPVELAGEGTDEIRTSLGVYSLGGFPNIENLTGTGSLGQELTGNNANNRIDGGLGADTMIGGAGNDTYVVDNAGDVVTENPGEGTDTVLSSIGYTLGSTLENLTLTGSAAISGRGNPLANIIIGNDAANLLQGGAGNDTLNGGLGADRLEGGLGADFMNGGPGDDVYVVENVLDTVIEGPGQGVDTVKSSVSFTLSANVEKLTLFGSSAIDGTGNALDNTIIGNSAANRLDGGAGADVLKGGGGDDTYIVDNVGDQAIDVAGGGVDSLTASVSYAISYYIENLTLVGPTALNGTGNGRDNIITGNSNANELKGANGNDQLLGMNGADSLIGGNGDDILDGGAGADTLRGGDGIDTLMGGAGADSLTGGGGSDTYVFNTALGAGNVDGIADFEIGADRIELSSSIFAAAGPEGILALDAFYAGTSAHDASDRIIYDSATGRIYYDSDGTGAASQVLFAQVSGGLVLSNTDFSISGSSAAAFSAPIQAAEEPATELQLIWMGEGGHGWIGRESHGYTHTTDWFLLDG